MDSFLESTDPIPKPFRVRTCGEGGAYIVSRQMTKAIFSPPLLAVTSRNNSPIFSSSAEGNEACKARIFLVSYGPLITHTTKEVGMKDAAGEMGTGPDEKFPSPSAAAASQKSSSSPQSVAHMLAGARLYPRWIRSLWSSTYMWPEAARASRAY